MFKQYFGKWYFIHSCFCTKIFLIPTLFCNALDWWRLSLFWCLLVKLFEICKAEERGRGTNPTRLTLITLPVFSHLLLGTGPRFTKEEVAALSGWAHSRGVGEQRFTHGSPWLQKPWFALSPFLPCVSALCQRYAKETLMRCSRAAALVP